MRFTADVEAAAYFLVCEALTNAAKHAAANSVVVELVATGSALTVSVQDDGAGMVGSPVDGSAGMGLVNLRDRVEALGGSLAVVTGADRGMLVRASLPLAGAR